MDPGIRLSEILSAVKGDDLYWSIIHLWATGDFGKTSLLDEEKKFNDPSSQVILSWNDMKAIADKFYDLIDIIVIASKSKESIKHYDDAKVMYEKCELVLEKNDSTYWLIHSHDANRVIKLQESKNQENTDNGNIPGTLDHIPFNK